MNHPFIKMLRFEWRSNYKTWAYYLLAVIGILLVPALNKNNQNLPLITSSTLWSWAFFILIYTIFAYPESKAGQTMQMYHLIPVSAKIKFISKQFLTSIASPIIILITVVLASSILKVLTNKIAVFDWTNIDEIPFNLIKFLIFWHSVFTFIAVSFHKNKLSRSISVFLLLKLTLAYLLYWVTVLFRISNQSAPPLSITSDPFYKTPFIVVLILAATAYTLSYRQFLRRQL